MLFVLPTLAGGGAERVFLVLLRGFDRDRFEPHLVLLQKGDPKRAEPAIPNDVVVHRLERARVRSAAFALVKLVRTIRPHAVFSPLGYVNLLVLMLKPLFPSLARVFVREANTPSCAIATMRAPKFYRFLYRKLYPRADGILCQSEGIRQDLFGVLGAKPPCPVIIADNPVDREETAKLARAEGDPFPADARPRLVAAGRLVMQKGFDVLIEAFASFARDFPRASLVILGEGPERKNLEDRVGGFSLSDRVQFAGFKKNPCPYYAHADVFALPSRWEGMPNAVLEALACGAPVVAFRGVGAVDDIVTDGVSGAFSDGASPEAFAAGLSRAYRIFSGRARVDLLPTRFDAAVAVRRYEEFVSGGNLS